MVVALVCSSPAFLAAAAPRPSRASSPRLHSVPRAPASDACVGAAALWRSQYSRYYCEPCSVGFQSLKNFDEHLAGKGHAAAALLSPIRAAEFKGTAWFEGDETAAAAAGAVFSLDAFIHGLPRRTRSGTPVPPLQGDVKSGCIDPHLMVSELPPVKRAQLWRCMRELLPDSSLAAAALLRLCSRTPQYARVKEVLETVEVFRHVERFVVQHRVSSIYDVACGHGMLSLLLSHRFPNAPVVAVDLVQRGSFAAHSAAWQDAVRDGSSSLSPRARSGGRSPRESRNVDEPSGGRSGIRFVQADLLEVLRSALQLRTMNTSTGMSYQGRAGAVHFATAATVSSASGIARSSEAAAQKGDGLEVKTSDLASLDESALVVCVHGCKDANQAAVQVARQAGAGWLILPCCLAKGSHLSGARVRLDDEVRYHILCGAMASEYAAKLVSSIDSRISPRALVLAAPPRRT